MSRRRTGTIIKWYRNWAVARLLVESLRGVVGPYPQPPLGLEWLRADLKAPN